MPADSVFLTDLESPIASFRASGSLAKGGDVLLLPSWRNEDWEQLFRFTSTRRVRAGKALIQRGAPDRTLYFVLHGNLEVIVHSGHRRTLGRVALVEAGSVLGEIAFFDDGARSAGAWAVNDCEVAAMTPDQYTAFEQSSPNLAHELLFALGRILAIRLRRTIDARYRINRFRTSTIMALGTLPPFWRERMAERFLRRADAPGPAVEHVVQYLVGAAKHRKKPGSLRENTVAKGADNFYEGQYRQYFNPKMGAFAMTATRALLAASGAPRGLLWWRRRKSAAAMLEEIAGVTPILVLSHQTVAVPIMLPLPSSQADRDAAMRWLLGRGTVPLCYRNLVDGEEVNCVEPNVCARERGQDGALLELLDCVIKSGKLALLALHPHDPDAMGLHITLFAAEILEPKRLERDYGLNPTELDAYRNAAIDRKCCLLFCVGGTEEIFTQCSQNIFIKRPVIGEVSGTRPLWPNAWHPALPLERLFDAQFETFQITVSASGLPGASPRNGDRGKAAFIGRHGGTVFVLIPYFPGNAIHGHAAKLWSNEHGALIIFDDHSALTTVTIAGPAFVVSHEKVERDFPLIARKVNAGRRGSDAFASNPEYWYQQQVVELVQQREPLAANSLDPQRPTCSISAGGHAKHGKKPAYFDAYSLKPYDQVLQHLREVAGRPVDQTGLEHRQWNENVRSHLDARRAHLQSALARL